MKNEQLKYYYFLIEFILFFFGVPLLLLFEGDIIHPSSVLLPFLLVIFLILNFTKGFKWKELWAFPISWKQLYTQIIIAIGVSMVMLAWVYFFDRKNLFNLPRGNWRVWLALSTFYPIFSAYVQEVIFRTFIFRRYHRVFGNGRLMIIASAFVFSFAHIFYFHPVSMALTFLLGLYLGWIYQRIQSVLFVAFLHGIYGNMVFTIGLGHYFWLDMFKWL